MTRTFGHFGVLGAIVFALTAAARPDSALARQEKPQVVEIAAERFSFTPSEFRVKADRPVEIRLRSDDTDHGF